MLQTPNNLDNLLEKAIIPPDHLYEVYGKDLGGKKKKREVLQEEDLSNNMAAARDLIAFFRKYPDIFVDWMNSKYPNNTFHFYTYQRVFLRCAMRYVILYATFPRAYSKSFLSFFALILKAILYPGSELFVTTGGKEQAAGIASQKILEICKLCPFIKEEIVWETEKDKSKDKAIQRSKTTGDDICFNFRNGSSISVVGATERSRGKRKVGGIMEECVQIDGDILNEVIIPIMNIDRRLPDGSRNPYEPVNKSQIYITTAGFKESFAYERLVEILMQSVLDPDVAIVLGGTIDVPIKEGLIDESFIDNLRVQDSYDETAFDREYNSRWSGAAKGAYFSIEDYDRARVLKQPEDKASGRISSKAYYVVAVDVGRLQCSSEVSIIKVTPQPDSHSIKQLVNMYSYEDMPFDQQALALKKLYYKYNAKRLVIDGNGLGVGLLDFMTISQIDPETNEEYKPFGIYGGTSEKFKEQYARVRGEGVENDAIYVIKANEDINSEAYSYTKLSFKNSRIRLLEDESSAKVSLLETKLGRSMTAEERNTRLAPFRMTTSLKTEMMNFVVDFQDQKIKLKKVNKKIPSDKFSAFIYGMFYIKQEEESDSKREGTTLSDGLCFTPSSNVTKFFGKAKRFS